MSVATTEGLDAIDSMDGNYELQLESDTSLSADSFGSGSTGDNSTVALIDQYNMVAMGHAADYGIAVGNVGIKTSPVVRKQKFVAEARKIDK